MPAQWTADVVGEMHLAGIKAREIAEEMGMTAAYVSMVLGGKRTPNGAEERFREAVKKLKEQKAGA